MHIAYMPSFNMATFACPPPPAPRINARYILVIEKDAIFQRLAEDRLADTLPCIMITAKVVGLSI